MQDVFKSGVVLTTVAALIAVLSFLYILMLCFTQKLAARTLRVQSLSLAFCATWQFATLIPFTDFFANRSAQVSASIGGVALPPSLIQQAEQALGANPVYHKVGYRKSPDVRRETACSLLTWDICAVRLLAVLPWISLLFTVIAAAVLFVAGSRARRAGPSASSPETAEAHATADGRRSEAGTVEKTEV